MQKQYVHHKQTYDSYVLRRVNKSLKSIPSHVKRRFAKDVQKWISHNGKVYTVKRLKDIKQIILSANSEWYTNHAMPVVDQSEFSSTIAMQSRTLMKGYLGRLQLDSLRSPKCLEQTIQLLNCYTLIVDEGTTPEDIDTLMSVIQPYPEPKAQAYITDFCNKLDGDKIRRYMYKAFASVQFKETHYELVDNKCTQVTTMSTKDMRSLLTKEIGFPRPYALTQPTEDHENDYFLQQAGEFNSSGLAYAIRHIMPELWEYNSIPDFKPRNHLACKHFPVGKMVLLNEGGLKKRWVENTKHIIQHIVKPYGNRLYDLVKYCPWDCTFDEFKGYRTIQKRLQQGKKCFSVDLSKATDKIPMEYNTAVLKQLLKAIPDANKHIKVFELIAKSNVLLPDITDKYPEYTRKYTGWGTGQPMGAFPSFAMLTLVHGLILFILNGYKYDDSYVVHGDDVVILNEELYHAYIEFLVNSGMEYSPYKTIQGTYFAEMNSKIITAYEILNPVKWKEISAKNCLDVAQYWGSDLVSILAANKKYSQKIIKDVLSLPYPLGAGLNPEGLSLEKRLDSFPGLIDSLLEESEAVNYITSYRDLVKERYSRHRDKYSYGLMDYDLFQAYLRDLNYADMLDRECLYQVPALTQALGLDNSTIYYESAFLNRAFLSGKLSLKLDKVSRTLEKTSNKRRKKEQSTRLKTVASFHVAKVKVNPRKNHKVAIATKTDGKQSLINTRW